MNSKIFLTIVITLVTFSSLSIFPAKSQSLDNSSVSLQTQPNYNQEQAIKIETFADRVTLTKGETLNYKVWVKSNLTDSVTVSVFFAQEQLVLNGKDSQPISLPQTEPVNFTFKAKDTGKLNILTRVSGIDKKTKGLLTKNLVIQGIEIKDPDIWWLNLSSNPLFGVFIGAFLTFGTTLLNDYRLIRKEGKQRKQWIIANLPVLIESDKQAVYKKENTKSEAWLSKLLTEGYYTDLQQLIKNQPDKIDLLKELMEVASDLREYERLREMNRLDQIFQQSIANKLTKTLDKLSNIK